MLLKLFILILPLFFRISRADDPKMELIFVHSIFRHGDRTPGAPLKNDPVSPLLWSRGSGGYGQLTPEGMGEMFVLGKKLKDRYVQSGFLYDYYDSQQIYIRSTNMYRTINSAFAMTLGLFSGGGRPGIDYPNISGWPQGVMPIPVQTADTWQKDCVANAFCECERREELLKIAHTGEQFQKYIAGETYLKTMALISKLFDKEYTWNNMWEVHDSIYIELIHFPEILRNQSWWSDEFLHNLEDINRLSKLFVSGLYDPPVVGGIDVRKEILKTRGGPMINEISTRMRTKALCVRSPTKCDKYHEKLKFYAYSTHDHSVFAILAVLGLEEIVAGPEKLGEWPDYAADVQLELFQNKTDGKPYFRMLFQPNINSTFSVLTPKIKGCKGLEYCDLKVFGNRAKEFRPDRQMEEWCAVSPLPEPTADPMTRELLHSDDFTDSISFTNYWSLATVVVTLGLFRL